MSREYLRMLAIPLSGVMLLIAAHLSGAFELRSTKSFHVASVPVYRSVPLD